MGGSPPMEAIHEGFHSRFAEMSWQVLPSYVGRLKEWCGSGSDPEGYPLRARAEALRIFFGLQVGVLTEIVQALSEASLDYTLLKGTASRLALYSSPDLRGGIDLDVAIRADAARDGRRVAHALGFVQSAWDERLRDFVTASSEQRDWIDANHYELGFLIRRHVVSDLTDEQMVTIRAQMHLQPNPWHETPSGKLGVWINLDLHTGLSHDIPVEPLMASARPHRFRGLEVRIPSPAWLLFHSIYKLYWEGVFTYGKGLYQYADICRLANRISLADVEDFRALIERWRLHAAALHVLQRLPPDFGIPLSEPLSELVASFRRPALGAKPQEENNFGDVWGKLWGFR